MSRVVKKVLLTFLALLVLSGIGGYIFLRGSFQAPPNQLVLNKETATIPFSWQAIELDGSREPFGAMLLPVTIPGLERRFWMQFDLGAPYSLLCILVFIS